MYVYWVINIHLYICDVTMYMILYTLMVVHDTTIMQVLFNTQEGCVYRNAADPKQLSGSKPWKIFLQNGSSWDAVAQMNRRPSSEEVEASLYNALAATNPGTKILKNLFNNKKK